MTKTKWLKKEYVGVIVSINRVGYKHGMPLFAVTYADGHDEDMTEDEVNNLYRQ